MGSASSASVQRELDEVMASSMKESKLYNENNTDISIKSISDFNQKEVLEKSDRKEDSIKMEIKEVITGSSKLDGKNVKEDRIINVERKYQESENQTDTTVFADEGHEKTPLNDDENIKVKHEEEKETENIESQTLHSKEKDRCDENEKGAPKAEKLEELENNSLENKKEKKWEAITVTDLKSNNFSTEDSLKETSLNIVDHNVIDPPKSTNNEDNQTKDIKKNSTLSTEIKAPIIAKSSIVPGYIEKDEYYDDFDIIQ